jgi:hypothetical protein
MKSIKYIFFLVLVAAFLMVPTASAQLASNCSYPTFTHVGYDPAYTPCSSIFGTTVSISWTQAYNLACVNSNNNTTYWTYKTSNVTGYGQTECDALGSFSCLPVMNMYSTPAQNTSDYNRFYNQAYDTYYAGITTLSGCAKNGQFRQDFHQCGAVECVVYTCTICPKLPTSCCTCPCGSPIVLDISGQGYNLTSAAQGVMFDLKGDGNLWQMAWTAKGANNAFLTLPGADGLVHNGQQLFGNFTPQPSSDLPNGFRALAVYDLPANGGNGDGIIDARDAIFSSLRLWIDANHDGISQPDELYTLPALGINSISLSYKASEKRDQYGNVFEYRAQLNPNNPTDAGKTAYDVFFVVEPPSTTAQGQSCPVPGVRPTSAIVKR